MKLSKSEGGIGLIGIQDTVETAILGLRHYKKQKEIVNCCRTIEENEDRETPNEYKKRKNNERKRLWTEKQLPGQFIRQITRKASEDLWGWLKKLGLKRATEALIMTT